MAILFTRKMDIPITGVVLALGFGLATPWGIEAKMWWLGGAGLVAAAVFVALKSASHRTIIPAILRSIAVRRREGVTFPAPRFRRHRGRSA
jgi:hypothetical protein